MEKGTQAAGKRAVLIAGPTASGKSALAVEKARELGGIVINTDSMQVYDGLKVLTARPDAHESGGVAHYLYGIVPPSVRFSAGAWRREVERLIQQTDPSGKALVFVGGTGLYFAALTKGFIDMPPVPEAVVAKWSAKVEGLDRAGRVALLEEHDPEMARQLTEPDPQRMVRALSVREATGRSLTDWQVESSGGLLADYMVEKLVLDPGRDIVRGQIARRFETMLDHGAVEEVAGLMALGLDPDLPAMKAIGVREIADWQAGKTSREQAMELAVNATRQYAKRQRTWLRKHMADWDWIEA